MYVQKSLLERIREKTPMLPTREPTFKEKVKEVLPKEKIMAALKVAVVIIFTLVVLGTAEHLINRLM